MPTSHAVLRRLLADVGDVVSRLRAALPDKALVGTVVKRGHRLA